MAAEFCSSPKSTPARITESATPSKRSPDAPVSRFVLELKGGKKYALLENSENVCKKTQKAGLSFRAQNGKVLTTLTKISNSWGGGKGGKGKSKTDKPQKHRPKK